jgi:hypothetical protein
MRNDREEHVYSDGDGGVDGETEPQSISPVCFLVRAMATISQLKALLMPSPNLA